MKGAKILLFIVHIVEIHSSYPVDNIFIQIEIEKDKYNLVIIIQYKSFLFYNFIDGH